MFLAKLFKQAWKGIKVVFSLRKIKTVLEHLEEMSQIAMPYVEQVAQLIGKDEEITKLAVEWGFQPGGDFSISKFDDGGKALAQQLTRFMLSKSIREQLIADGKDLLTSPDAIRLKDSMINAASELAATIYRNARES